MLTFVNVVHVSFGFNKYIKYMSVLFSDGNITVTDNSVTFPSGFFYTGSTTLSRNKIISVKYLYDNFFMFYIWRFIFGFFQLFTIIAIPAAIKVLRGDVLVQLLVRENNVEQIYTFWLKHSKREEFRRACY